MPIQWDSNPHTSKRATAYGISKYHISTTETHFFRKLSSIWAQTLKNSAIPVLDRESLRISVSRDAKLLPYPSHQIINLPEAPTCFEATVFLCLVRVPVGIL